MQLSECITLSYCFVFLQVIQMHNTILALLTIDYSVLGELWLTLYITKHSYYKVLQRKKLQICYKWVYLK